MGCGEKLKIVPMRTWRNMPAPQRSFLPERCGLKNKFWMVRRRQLSIFVLAIISSVVSCFAAAACRVSSTLGSSSLAAIGTSVYTYLSSRRRSSSSA